MYVQIQNVFREIQIGYRRYHGRHGEVSKAPQGDLTDAAAEEQAEDAHDQNYKSNHTK